ncbi:MAG: recombinase family protein [Pseudomonadota bacterium]
MRIYAYLRASTHDQDANRAKDALNDFVQSANQAIAAWFIENESGATLKRPELFRLLDIAQNGDVLLIEQVDRISRLNANDWEKLKAIIKSKGIRIVALDLPTSHQFMQTTSDEFTQRMFAAINYMMLDMLAAVARKDYIDRRRRQSEGISKAKLDGKYKGRQVNQKLHQNIAALLRDGKSYRDIRELLGCSQSTISLVKKQNNIEVKTVRSNGV